MFTLADLYRALRRPVPAQAENVVCTGLCHDSRILQQGEVFLALRTERRDGHAFIPDAAARGAAAILCQRPRTDLALPQVRVRDSIAAGWKLARYLTQHHQQARIVAVTGSYGKTTTKDAIAAVLSQRLRVVQTSGTENNEIGIPRTVARLTPETQALVLEMGAQWVGEIAGYCRYVRPHMAVVTAVGPVHLELFGSLAGVQQAKSELVRALPRDGLAVLNGDDPLVREMAQVSPAPVWFYGTTSEAAVQARDIRLLPTSRTRFDLVWREQKVPVETSLVGRAGAYAALAAAAVGLACGLTLTEVAAGLATLAPPAGRLNVQPGRHGTRLLNDAYNANRISTILALEVLSQLAGSGRRFAVLGDMLELGPYAPEEHRLVGEATARHVDRLILVGQLARHIAEGALQAGMPAERITLLTADLANSTSLETALTAAEGLLEQEMRPHDMVLIKSSHGAGLYKLAERWVETLIDS